MRGSILERSIGDEQASSRSSRRQPGSHSHRRRSEHSSRLKSQAAHKTSVHMRKIDQPQKALTYLTLAPSLAPIVYSDFTNKHVLSKKAEAAAKAMGQPDKQKPIKELFRELGVEKKKLEGFLTPDDISIILEFIRRKQEAAPLSQPPIRLWSEVDAEAMDRAAKVVAAKAKQEEEEEEEEAARAAAEKAATEKAATEKAAAEKAAEEEEERDREKRLNKYRKNDKKRTRWQKRKDAVVAKAAEEAAEEAERAAITRKKLRRKGRRKLGGKRKKSKKRRRKTEKKKS